MHANDKPQYVELTMEFRFEASHQLPQAPPESLCRRLHGHSWRAEVTVEGAIDPKTGWLIDYHEIEAAWAPLYRALDHRHLNDVPGLDNPTSEMIALWIWDRLAGTVPGLLRITIHETCTARCSFFGPGRGRKEA